MALSLATEAIPTRTTSITLVGIVKLFRGHVAQLLRQPYGADVITDLYDVASSADRNAMCAEFYGKEFVLFGGLSGEAGRLHSLKQLMANAPPAKQRAVVLHMTKALTPIMEKALLHPPMTHRYGSVCVKCVLGRRGAVSVLVCVVGAL